MTQGNGGCFSSFIDSPLRRPLNHEEQRAVVHVCNSHHDDDDEEQQQLEDCWRC